MLSQIRTSSLVIGSLLLASVAAKPAAIAVNGTCEVGSCNSVDSVSSGQSVGPTNFAFNYAFVNGDAYRLSGTYSAAYGSNGSAIGINLSAIYTGSSASVGADTMTFDMFQNYFDNGPGSFDGTYTEQVPVTVSGNVGPGSTVTAQLFYDNKGLGQIGPFGIGSNYGQKSTALTGLTGNTLAADFNFILNFQPGTQPGAGDLIPAVTPEPSQFLPIAGTLLAIGAAALRRFRKAA